MDDLKHALRSDAETQKILHAHGFDEAELAVFRERCRAGEAGAGRLSPDDVTLLEDAFPRLPPPGSEAHAALTWRGEAALQAGELGLLVLAGGMATRFGGGVKALAPAYLATTFLGLKLRDARRAAERGGRPVPFLVMSSFATHAELAKALAKVKDDAIPVDLFCQDLSLRLTPDGELFVDDAGRLSPYATGHGDLVPALRRSGALQRFRERGGKTLLMTNVDNVLATLDPALIGAHLESGAALTVELVRKREGDRGGVPAQVRGSEEIVEAFRFPSELDPDTVPLFNTNTFWLDAEAIDRDFELDYFRAEKDLGGRTAIQFERLVGQLTAHLPTHFIEVPRAGSMSRFAPVKTPDDLARLREELTDTLRSRGLDQD